MQQIVSVVVRTKDRPTFLARALESIAAQDFEGWNVIVVNDGGERGAVERCVKARGQNANIQVLHNDRSLGMEAAANRGVIAAATPYIALLDDDDTWHPTFLTKAVAFLEADEFGRTCVGAAAQTTVIFESRDGDTYREARRAVMNPQLRKLTLYRVASRNQISNNALVFRRSAYDEVGGFDETLPVLGDWDFLLKLLKVGDIGVLPEPLANYHQRDATSGAADANSFAGSTNRHDHFDARIQNKHMRAALAGDGVAMALAMGMGREVDVLQRELDLTRAENNDMRRLAAELNAKVDQMSARLDAIERQLARVRRVLGRPARALSKAWSRASTLFR